MNGKRSPNFDKNDLEINFRDRIVPPRSVRALEVRNFVRRYQLIFAAMKLYNTGEVNVLVGDGISKLNLDFGTFPLFRFLTFILLSFR